MLKLFRRPLISQVFMLLSALGAFSTVAAEQAVKQDNREVKIKQYKWFGDSPKAKRIRVINPYGNITSRTSYYSSVELSGAIQKIGKNPPQHQIDINDNNGVTEVVVSYPDGIRNAMGQLAGRVDLGVWVPSWVSIELETDFGDIKVKKSASNITAKSNSGKISIGTSGLVEAQSDSGNISIDFYDERYRQSMKVVSKTGDVKVNLSQNAKVQIDAQSGHKISNNFADYPKVKVTKKDLGLNAKIALVRPGGKVKLTPLVLSAVKGKLKINIADTVSRKIKKTPVNQIAKKN